AWLAAVAAAPVIWPVGLPLASTVTPGEVGVSPSTSSAFWFTRAPEMPAPVTHTGLFGAAVVSSSNVNGVGLSSCVTLQTPDSVQIHLPGPAAVALSV